MGVKELKMFESGMLRAIFVPTGRWEEHVACSDRCI
jgi:hypothetical protein